MDKICRHDVRRGPLIGVVPILVWHLVSFFNVILTQLQLCHILCLRSLQSADELHVQLPYLWHFLSQGNAAVSPKYIIVWTSHTRIMYCEFRRVFTSSIFACTQGWVHVTVFVVCLFHDNSITNEPFSWSAFCALLSRQVTLLRMWLHPLTVTRILGSTSYGTFPLVLNGSHTMEKLCANFFSLCIF